MGLKPAVVTRGLGKRYTEVGGWGLIFLPAVDRGYEGGLVPLYMYRLACLGGARRMGKVGRTKGGRDFFSLRSEVLET